MQLPLLILWCGIPLLAIWQMLATRGREIVERRCPNCDYDLTGARVGDSCPECGSIPSISNPGRSASDRVLCRGCGHDLEGLEWDVDCPECGLRRAALPKFEARRTTYRSRSLLGGVLLAIWIGFTLLMMVS